MQKKNIQKGISFIVVLMMVFMNVTGLCACNRSASGKNNPKYPLTAFSAIGSQNTVEAVLSKEYENLTFAENFCVEFPEIESFTTFTMTRKPGVSVQKTYERFEAALEQYFPGTFTAAEVLKLCKVVGNDAEGNTIDGTYEQIKDIIVENDNGIAMLLNSEKGFLQTFGCGYTQTATGTAAYSLDHPEGGNVGMYIAADANTVAERIFIPHNGTVEEREYLLLDGEVKLTDAIAYTEEFFKNGFDKDVANPELTPEVCEAWVVDMGDGIYGYHFTMTPVYRGIRFDAQPMNHAGSFGSEGERNSKAYENFPGYAFTIEKGKLDSIMIVGTKLAYDIETTRTYTEMITAEQATAILSEAVSGYAGLVIERAEFLYAPYSEEGGDRSTHTVDAVWRFVGRNENDGFRYLFYVNAVTGEFDYYKYS